MLQVQVQREAEALRSDRAAFAEQQVTGCVLHPCLRYPSCRSDAAGAQAEAGRRVAEAHKGEAAKLRRERSALERQAAALTKLPSQQDRQQVGPCWSPPGRSSWSSPSCARCQVCGSQLQRTRGSAGWLADECLQRGCPQVRSCQPPSLRYVVKENGEIDQQGCKGCKAWWLPAGGRAEMSKLWTVSVSAPLTTSPMAQLATLEAIVEQERRTCKAHEGRHRLEADRLRGQIADLQARWPLSPKKAA